MIKNTFLATAMSLLSLSPLSAMDLNDLSPEERAQFREEVRSYLLDNPEVIMEAFAILEARERQAEAERDLKLVEINEDALYNDGFSYVGGNPDGDITLVEFLDYRCGYCRRAHPDVAELIASDGNIRLIVKEYPVLGEQSVAASRFAIATKMIAGPEAYKQVTDALITLRGDVTDESLLMIASEFGLDGAAIQAEMDSDAVTQVIAETRLLGQRMQITGTPSFVLGGRLMRGYVPLAGMQKVVEEARGG